MLETAEKYGRAPSHWLGGLDGEWGHKDHILTLSYTMYRDGLCSCGHPVAVAHEDEHDGWFVAKTSVCVACAAVDHKRDDDKPAPGEKVYTVDEREDVSPTTNQSQQ